MKSTKFNICLSPLLFSVALVYGSLLPLKFKPSQFWAGVSDLFLQCKTADLVFDLQDTPLNILLYVPLGFLLFQALSLFTPKKRFFAVVLLSLLLSCSIEIAQALSVYRVSSLSDIVANVLGASLGALITARPLLQALFLLGRRCEQQIRKTRRTLLSIESLRPYSGIETQTILRASFLLYFGFLVSCLLLPLRFDFDVASIMQDFARLLEPPFISLQKEAYSKVLEQVIVKLVLFVPVGLLLRLLSSQLKASAVFVPVILAFAIELMQCGLVSHYAASGDVVLYVVSAYMSWVVTDLFLNYRSIPLLLRSEKERKALVV